MNLPFTTEQFLEVFARYNNAIWPIQVLLNLAALAAVYLAIRRYSFSDRVISTILGLSWLWMGLVYHLGFFSTINPAAYGFGALCAVQGLMFIRVGLRKNVSYRATLGWRQSIGSIFILYALLMYPYLGMKFGHLFPYAPSFGAPCPTTIFTFGVLLWATGLPRTVLIIPALWSVIGFSAALTMGIYEDVGLLIAGITGTALMLIDKSGRHVSGERSMSKP